MHGAAEFRLDLRHVKEDGMAEVFLACRHYRYVLSIDSEELRALKHREYMSVIPTDGGNMLPISMIRQLLLQVWADFHLPDCAEFDPLLRVCGMDEQLLPPRRPYTAQEYALITRRREDLVPRSAA